MALRPPRRAPGYHHVVTRGNNKRRIFEDHVDRWFFCKTVERIASKHGWTILAYCLMDNHYHLVLRVGERGLARGMCELNTACALHYNARHGRINHLFGKRYWNRYLQTDATVVNALRYVVQNPRRAGGRRPLEGYVWASYGATIGVASARIDLDREQVLRVLRHESRARGRGVSRLLRRHASQRPRPVAATVTRRAPPSYVSVYSGPLPPSGGVRRPPLAVIAPHWTQFEGASFTSTVPSPSASLRPRRPAPGRGAPTSPPARAGPSSGYECDSAGRRACGCPTRTRSTACRR